MPAFFPKKAWDGTSPSRKDPVANCEPDGQDWAQIVAELVATQTEVFNLQVKLGHAMDLIGKLTPLKNVKNDPSRQAASSS